MRRRIFAAALALAVVIPALAAAQERERSSIRGGRLERPSVHTFAFNRARLGVTIQTRADAETDRYGARIVSVLESSPADSAGLKAGDIVTRFGSTSLVGAKPEGGDEDSNLSGPGLKLVELAQELDAGDTVKIEYRRDGDTRSATIVAREIGPDVSFRSFVGPDMPMPMMESPGYKEAPGHFEMFGGEPGGLQMFRDGPANFTFFMGNNLGLQMVEMNADLGEYFGTNEGLLVIKPSRDSTIPLRAGDVILSIDGRKPTSVSHALRIIGSYDEGETVKAEVLRKRQRVNVEWVVKEVETRVRTMRPSRLPYKVRGMPIPDRSQL